MFVCLGNRLPKIPTDTWTGNGDLQGDTHGVSVLGETGIPPSGGTAGTPLRMSNSPKVSKERRESGQQDTETKDPRDGYRSQVKRVRPKKRTL